MYTVVLKQMQGNLIVFDVMKKSFFTNQSIVGNIFCSKDNEGKYQVTTSMYMASMPEMKFKSFL